MTTTGAVSVSVPLSLRHELWHRESTEDLEELVNALLRDGMQQVLGMLRASAGPALTRMAELAGIS